MDFIVIDTEGKEQLTEIAIIDSQGTLIIERFIEDNLEEVLLEIEPILTTHRVVAHSAAHDKQLLQKSYHTIGKTIQLTTQCTFQKSKKLLPHLNPHALETLSTALFLEGEGGYFNHDLAHRSSYDARFTYLLYRKLLSIEASLSKAKKINPFSSSKVDNPFQEHFDDKTLYQEEFKTLYGLLDEIKHDSNAQSKTALVIGEAGNGKTHMMMRFLNEVSTTNRFLFIGKPNSKERVLFHTYTKILESFIQKIDNSPYSQLEYLLAKSFATIIIANTKNQKIVETLRQNHLNIYERFGKAESDQKRKNWNSIEKTMLKWYNETHGSDPVCINILKALIKYTFYVDENRRDSVINYLSGKDMEEEVLQSVGLASWSQEVDLEAFSLKAIALFGQLSIFDEPLILSFDQLEAMSHDEPLLMTFGQSLKELLTHTPNSLVILNLFPNRWQEYEALFDGSVIDLIGKNKIILERPANDKLKQMLQQRASWYGIDLNHIFTDNRNYKDILQHNSIRAVVNRASDYFKYYVNGTPLPKEVAMSLEYQVEQLLQRVAHLESLQNIEQTPKKQKMDFNIESYIYKVYRQKNQEYDRKCIIDDKNDIDKLKFILKSIDMLYHFKLDFFKTRKVLPEHLIISTKKYSYVVGFLHVEGRLFVNRIKNFNQFVINQNAHHFRLFRDSRESKIRGKVSKDEQEKLNNSPKGKFVMMHREDRVIYETIYQLIVDMQNRDIECSIEALMQGVFTTYEAFWLVKLLKS